MPKTDHGLCESFILDGHTYIIPINVVVEIERLRLVLKRAEEAGTALRNLVDALAANDEDGLTEFAPQMQAARAALAWETKIDAIEDEANCPIGAGRLAQE